MEIEEDTYSSIFQALKHPIRRRILRMLKEHPMTYTEILNELGIENGLLNYHLENLLELLAKGEDDKYRLSEFGEAGLSVIDRVETPKVSHTKSKYLKPGNWPTLIIIVLLFVSALTNGYYFNLNKNLRDENLELRTSDLETVSGIVIHRSSETVWLRLSTSDQLNEKEVGSIMNYTLRDNDEDIEIGDHIMCKLTGNNTIITQQVTPFFEYSYHDGYMVSGDLLLYSGGKITDDLSDPYPSLRFGIKNLGDKEIIAIRATVNDVFLPYTWGISEESPLRPSREEWFSRYTAWYEPGGHTGGFVPVDGEEYNVSVTVKFSDLSTRTFTSLGLFEESNIGSIRFMGGRDFLSFRDADLLWHGLNRGNTVSLHFRNIWYQEPVGMNQTIRIGETGMQTVEELELYLNGVMVWKEDVTIEPSRYFALTVHIPRDLDPGDKYDVTLVAYSEQGLNATSTVTALCQYIRIN
jgi:DNA-binding transcriptional ArsR family regulator